MFLAQNGISKVFKYTMSLDFSVRFHEKPVSVFTLMILIAVFLKFKYSVILLVLWMKRVKCVSTCHVENRVVHSEGTVLAALPFPVHHDLHDFCPQRDVAGVDGHAGGGAVARLVVLAWDDQR